MCGVSRPKARSGGHWDHVYRETEPEQVSWFQSRPLVSERLLTGATNPAASVLDVGGGASRLADVLLDRGWSDVTVLDISAEALSAVDARLRGRRPAPALVVTDVLHWRPERRYDAWHDRAVFHFLTAAADRRRYVRIAEQALAPGGVLVLGTFAPDGPERCSGLPTTRWEAGALAAQFAEGFTLVHDEREEHLTPAGACQPFTWVVLLRRG